jgi:hypothetical protein
MDIIETAQRHIERLDIVVRACEIKWGVCFGIEMKIPKDLWDKFQRQWDALSAAISGCDHASVPDLADGAVRGVWAMEKAALDAGYTPEPLLPCAVRPWQQETPKPASNGIQERSKEFWKNGGDELPI